MKKILKKNKAITLIALVITIVVLVILAAVIISISIGNDGLINRALKAAKGYKDAKENEKVGINDLYGQLTVAADGTIQNLTLTQLETILDKKISDNNEKIDTTIDNKIATAIQGLNTNKSVQSCKASFAYVSNENTLAAGTYSFISTSPNIAGSRNIDETYFTFDSSKGLRVNKTGWYMVSAITQGLYNSELSDCQQHFIINSNSILTGQSSERQAAQLGAINTTTSVYLKEGDYFNVDYKVGKALIWAQFRVWIYPCF